MSSINKTSSYTSIYFNSIKSDVFINSNSESTHSTHTLPQSTTSPRESNKSLNPYLSDNISPSINSTIESILVSLSDIPSTHHSTVEPEPATEVYNPVSQLKNMLKEFNVYPSLLLCFVAYIINLFRQFSC